MKLLNSVMAAAMVAAFALPGMADEPTIVVEDSYARSSMKMAKTGAAFMIIKNLGDVDDRVVAARSDVSKRVELHTHVEVTENGQTYMKMGIMEGGFPIPAHGQTVLKRGGMHVMFMGLNRPLVQGENVHVTLVLEKAGEVEIDVPVDLKRKPAEGGKMMHKHGDGKMMKKHGEHSN